MTPRALLEPARLAGTPLLRTQTDERLVDLTRAGNTRAFEAIVHRYRRPLLRYCSRLLPAEQAEDTVQQSFVRAYEAIRAGDAELNLRPWLYRITHNAAVDALRRGGWAHEPLSEQIDGVERPDQAVERSERLGSVLAAVQRLPERQRNAVVLRELEGRSYDEIAAELGVTGGAVRQLLNRARSTLRAAATVATPGPVAARLAAGGEGEGVAARVAEICAGAGTGAALAKLGAAVIVTGAVAGSAVDAPVPLVGERDGREREAQAASMDASAPAPEDRAAGLSAEGGDRPTEGGSKSSTGGGDDREGRRRGGDREGDDRRGSGDGDRDSSGPGGGDVDNSGPGGGGGEEEDNSGPGSGGGEEEDNSGPGGGGGSNSGPGSGDSGSGSGSSGSGSSGSDSSGSGSSGSGSSGSGSSGSG